MLACPFNRQPQRCDPREEERGCLEEERMIVSWAWGRSYLGCFSLKDFSNTSYLSQEWVNFPFEIPAKSTGHVAAQDSALLLSMRALCLVLFWTPPFGTLIGVIRCIKYLFVLRLTFGSSARGLSQLPLAYGITSSIDVQLSFRRSLAPASSVARMLLSETAVGQPGDGWLTDCKRCLAALHDRFE